MTFDATERMLAQFQAVLAAALDPIITIDCRGVIQSASDSLERVFGWTPPEVIGRNVNMLMPEPHHSQHDGYLAAYRCTRKTNILGRTREFHAMRKDGSEFPIELSVSRVDLPGADEPWFMGIIHDATERKRAEAELEQHRAHLEAMVKRRTEQLESSNEQLRQADRLASIGTLAAGLGHDMNNVLLPIRARLDALDAADLPAHAREQFQAVRRSVNYLQQLSDGLHLMALDARDADASSGETNIAEWWSQVGALLSKAVPKRIALSVEIEPNLPLVAMPPHRLTQSVLNLLVNAGEAIPAEGQIRLWARARQRRGFVRIGVTDNGEGMSPEVKRHALDPFFTTKRRGLGTGLGLSLVHGVAQAAGGSVHIESNHGQGTTVALNLPAAKSRRAGHDQSAPHERTVIISVCDRRGASMMTGLLEAQGFLVTRTDAHTYQTDELPSRLWIVDPSIGREAIEAYLQRDAARRVVLFGAPDFPADAPEVFAIDDPTNMESIRRTLGQAIAAVGAHQ